MLVIFFMLLVIDPHNFGIYVHNNCEKLTTLKIKFSRTTLTVLTLNFELDSNSVYSQLSSPDDFSVPLRRP